MFLPVIFIFEILFILFYSIFNIVWYILFVNLVDLSNFFNKFVLNIPAEHPMLQIRYIIYIYELNNLIILLNIIITEYSFGDF
jgi:hypothetical protein